MNNLGVITINLTALADNWRALKNWVGENVDCAAVVKANAYGLGIKPVALALADAGCRTYFVANVPEALELRAIFVEGAKNHQSTSGYVENTIFVLSGCPQAMEPVFLQHRLCPVLISAPMLQRWATFIEQSLDSFPALCMLKVDTGMSRYGVEYDEVMALINDKKLLLNAGVSHLMSHMACADNVDHPLNERQLKKFENLHNQCELSGLKFNFSLANSTAAQNFSASHYNMIRPGIALYGGMVPSNRSGIKIKPVVSLDVPVVQVRKIKKGDVVGYGADYIAPNDLSVAIVAGGYADGLMRGLQSKPVCAYYKNVALPLVGRVSMDSMIFDLTPLNTSGSNALPVEGDMLSLVGDSQSLEAIASAAGTINYEMLTRLGSRFMRRYV